MHRFSVLGLIYPNKYPNCTAESYLQTKTARILPRTAFFFIVNMALPTNFKKYQ